jgi:hypothetical protein
MNKEINKNKKKDHELSVVTLKLVRYFYVTTLYKEFAVLLFKSDHV